MPSPDVSLPGPSTAEIESRICQAFLTLNQMAASLALIERSCTRVLDDMPIADEDALQNALALRGALKYVQLTLEQTGDVSDAITRVARYLGGLKKDSQAPADSPSWATSEDTDGRP